MLGRPGLANALNVLESESNNIGMFNFCDRQNICTRFNFSLVSFPCSSVFTAKTLTGNFSSAAQSATDCVSLSAFQHGTHQVAQKSRSTMEPRTSCKAIFLASRVSSSKSGASEPNASRFDVSSVRLLTTLREPTVKVIGGPADARGENVPFTRTRNPSGAPVGFT